MYNNKNIWIVGGYIRDWLLQRECNDIDLVTDANAKKVAQIFAKKNKGSFITLDDFNKIYRVVIKDKIYDFSQLQGMGGSREMWIVDDLSRRDFTINAMATQITDCPPTSRRAGRLQIADIIDPFNGLADIKNKIIRTICEKNLVADPLRLLRAYRFAGQLNFKIEPKTKKYIKNYSRNLKNIPSERILYELFLILELQNSYSVILELYKSGLLNELFPELISAKNIAKCYYPEMGLLGHSFDTLKVLEKFYTAGFKNVFPQYTKKIIQHLEQKISRTIKRKTLLKLAALLHDIGKPTVAKKIDGRLRFFEHEERGCETIVNIGKRLKLSNTEINYLIKLIRHHMRIGNLTTAKMLTDKAVWRFFRDLTDDAIDLIVLSVADAYTYPKGRTRTLHKIIANKLLHKYYSKKEKIIPKKLLNGFDVMRILKIPEGPLVGKILQKIEETQVIKKISTKQDAEKYIKHLDKTKKNL
ncbi:MAG: HD domain-containing protein [Elusimicrobiota bacterium]